MLVIGTFFLFSVWSWSWWDPPSMQDVSVLPAFRMCLPFSVKMSWYMASWIDSEMCCHSDSKSKQVDKISHHNTDKLVYYPLAVIRFSNESNLREKGFVLTFPGHSSSPQRRPWSRSLALILTWCLWSRSTEHWLLMFSLLSLFYTVQDLSRGSGLACLSPMNLSKLIPYRHTERAVPQVTLNVIKLTIEVNPHSK